MLPFLFRRRRERELSEEIRSHFDMAVEERIERGQSREEAERAVRREFGNEVHVREVTRMMWGGMWLDRLAQDLRFGVRSLVRDRGFAFVAVLTLGLGIGVTTAMFTVVNGVLLRPLPFFEPDRLVSVSIQSPTEMTGDVASQRVLDAHFVEIRRDSFPFSSVSTYTNYPPVTLTGAGDPVRLNAGHVTSEFMQVLGVEPRLGTGFRSGDDRLASDPVVVLSDALWRERFTADPGVIGRYATIEGVDRRIVGVMPSGFAFPNRADLWIPLPVEPADHSFERPVVARLQGDMTIEAATDVLSARFVGRADGELRAALTPLKDVLVGEGRYPLMVLVGAVVMVLLIACTNVANLLLMRARRREGEMGLRKVLGAGKGRLVRQLLTESTLVALLGGCVGVVVAIVGVEVLVAVAPWGTLPRSEELGVDWTALAFTLCLSGVTGIAFGLAPAFRACRKELREVIGVGTHQYSPARGWLRGTFVIAEVALAVVLLTGAGLLLRSFQQLRAIELGFRPENTLTFEADLPVDIYRDAGTMRALHRQVVDGLRRIPGVTAAGGANFEPLGLNAARGTYTVEAPAEGISGRCERCVGVSIVSTGYFAAMGMPIVSGRGFTPGDDDAAPPVVVVSRNMAERFWPDGDAVGRRIAGGRSPEEGDWMTIVGVTGDVIRSDVTEAKDPMLYRPLAQTDDAFFLGHMRYVVRTSSGRTGLVPALRQVLRDADPNLPLGAVSTMDEIVVASIGDRVFQTRLLGGFAILALLLAAIGVYGVTAYSVNERIREIGIRMALGAQSGQVAGRTLVGVLTLIVPGLVLGAVGGRLAASLIEASLYEVAAGDPATFAGVAVLLAGVAVVAVLVPIRRATRVNLVKVLSE